MSVRRLSLLVFMIAAQGFSGMPGSGFYPGFRGGYGYRGGFYGRPLQGGPRWGWGPGWFVPRLPLGCLTLSFGGAAWYYGGGFWYQPSGAGFVVAIPPVGLLVPVLPPDCSTVVLGGVTYFCANDVYYTAAAPGPGYVVAAPPPGQPPPGSPDAAALDALVIIPRNGQDEPRILADRQDAQRFASNQAGYDPARADPTDPGTPRARQRYLRVMKSYLEDRGYTVK
jgi:hypothetical protein